MKRPAMKALIVALLLSTALAAQTPGQSSWTIIPVAGPVGWPGHKLMLTAGQDSISFAIPKGKTLTTVPVAQITQIVSSPVRFSRSQQVVGGKTGHGTLGPYLMDSGYGPGGGAGIFLLLAALAIAAPMHGTSHYVTLTWADSGVEQQMLFEVSKSDLEPFTRQLRGILGERWIDVEEQRSRVEATVKDHQSEAVQIEFERDSWCGEFGFPKGAYRILAVLKGTEAEVYFFAGEVTFTQLRGIFHARVADPTGTESVEYAPGAGQIVSVPWQGKRLRLLQD